MKLISFFVFTLILGWLSAPQAQAWVDPYMQPDGPQVQGDYRSSPDGNSYNNNYSYLGSVNPYFGRQAGADPKLHLERNNGPQSNTGSGGSTQRPVYKPFTIYRH